MYGPAWCPRSTGTRGTRTLPATHRRQPRLPWFRIHDTVACSWTTPCRPRRTALPPTGGSGSDGRVRALSRTDRRRRRGRDPGLGWRGRGGARRTGRRGRRGQRGEPDSPDSPDEKSLAFLEILPATGAEFSARVDRLREEHGLRILVSFVPDVVICRATETELADLRNDPVVSLATSATIATAPPLHESNKVPGDPGLGRSIWNKLLAPDPPDTTLNPPLLTGCLGDSVVSGFPSSNREYQTSIVLIGKVGLSLIFVESAASEPACAYPDSIENWTAGNKQDVYTQYVDGSLRLPTWSRMHMWSFRSARSSRKRPSRWSPSACRPGHTATG